MCQVCRLSEYVFVYTQIGNSDILHTNLVPVPPWTVGDRAIAVLCSEEANAPLSHLRVVNCYVTKASCRQLARKFGKTLVSLDLTGAPVDDAGLECIAICCHQLEVLRVNSCAHITDAGCAYFSKLIMRPSQPWAAGTRALQHLIELDLKFAEITDAGLVELLHRTCLRPLQVSTMSGLSTFCSDSI